MTLQAILSPAERQQALSYLEVGAKPPSPVYLAELVDAYTRHVPWETISRNARRFMILDNQKRPRLPAEFWSMACLFGTGGTCFESNYAFMSLLMSLGFTGYLTINDMETRSGCHTACIVTFGETKYLADVGYPLYVPIPLNPSGVTEQKSAYFHYKVTALASPDTYEVRAARSNPYVFTLLDRPVSEADYIAATTADFLPSGLFNREIVIHRVRSGDVWRFNGRADPYQLLSMAPHRGGQMLSPSDRTTEHSLEADIPAQLQRLFGLPVEMIQMAFQAVNQLRTTGGDEA